MKVVIPIEITRDRLPNTQPKRDNEFVAPNNDLIKEGIQKIHFSREENRAILHGKKDERRSHIDRHPSQIQGRAIG